MNMPKPKLIAIDIDGTLIDSKTEILPEVVEAIKKVVADGALIALATGRMISACEQYLRQLNIELPTIALNGSFVGWTDTRMEPIYSETISHGTAHKIIETAWDSDVTLILVDCDHAFVRNITNITGPALETWIVNISPLKNTLDIDGTEPSLILIAGDGGDVATLQRRTSSLGIPDIDHYLFPSIRYYPMHYLEIRTRGVDKGKGLAVLADYLGIRYEDILAIGDYINDVPMAGIAGTFAVPANAREDVRAVADYVSPLSNNEGAVAEILETLYFEGK